MGSHRVPTRRGEVRNRPGDRNVKSVECVQVTTNQLLRQLNTSVTARDSAAGSPGPWQRMAWSPMMEWSPLSWGMIDRVAGLCDEMGPPSISGMDRQRSCRT